MSQSTPMPIAAAPSWRTVLRDAGIIAGLAMLVAFATNAVRADRLPLVAKKQFDILVPCPEPLGKAVAVAPVDPRVVDANTLLIDARAPEEYRIWHLANAMNVPFDWLAEQDEIAKQAQRVARDVARTGKHAVVVYGDGGDPDSGQQWAAMLNTAGIRNVSYVTGGAVALSGPAVSKAQP